MENCQKKTVKSQNSSIIGIEGEQFHAKDTHVFNKIKENKS